MHRRVPGRVIVERARKANADFAAVRDRLAKAPTDAKRIHAFRKQARRLWAAVQLTELYLTPLQFSRIVHLVAPLADGLGDLRDDDVLGRRLQGLAKGRPGTLATGLRESATPMGKRKREARVEAALRRSKDKALARPLAEALAHVRPRWMEPLAVLRRRVHERSWGIHQTSSREALHALRLELKAYRYAVEALGREAGSFDVKAAKQARQAARLLGQVMDAHLLGLCAQAAPPRVARTILAAARRDDAAARKAFGKGWTKDWPDLRRLGA